MEQLVRQLFRTVAAEQAAGVEIQPVPFFAEQRLIGRDLQAGYKRPQRRAPAGREQNQLTAGGGQRRYSHQVIARSGQQRQPRLAYPAAIRQHIGHRRTAAFLDAAEGFLLQGGDAALFVAGRRILVDHLVVRPEILLEIVDHGDDAVEYFAIGRPGHQQRFRAEHFRRFGQHRAAAHRRQAVGDASHQRIGGDPGKRVRAAAFQADAQFGDSAFRPGRPRSVNGQLLDRGHTGGNLVSDRLGFEKFHPVGVPAPQHFLKLGDIVVLAAQPEYQHAAGVRVIRQIRQDLLRPPMVVAQLRTAVRMRKRVNPVQVRQNAEFPACLGGDELGDPVHAAHRRQDPDLVACANAAIWPAIASERSRRQLFRSQRRRRIFVVQQLAQAGRQVVDMHPLTGSNIGRSDTDRLTVFDDRFAAPDRPDSQLVRRRDRCSGPCLADRQIGQRHRDIIVRMNLHRFHRHASFPAFPLTFAGKTAYNGYRRQPVRKKGESSWNLILAMSASYSCSSWLFCTISGIPCFANDKELSASTTIAGSSLALQDASALRAAESPDIPAV